MSRYRVLVLFLPLTVLTLACSSHNRQLQSINIKATTNVGQIQFTASGTFSAPPTTVSPLPVDWSNGILAPLPRTLGYRLTTQPYVFDCSGSGTAVQVTALAPRDPASPLSGSSPSAKLVMANSTIVCP